MRRKPGPPSGTRRRLLAVTSLGLAGLLAGLLSGCSSGAASLLSSSPDFSQVSGNWQFSSTAASAARLSVVGGNLNVGALSPEGTVVTGIFHPLSTSSGQCLDASTALPLSGSIDTSGKLTLTSPVAGGTLSLSGIVAPDRRSLTSASYAITGGACASPSPQTALSTTPPARDSGSSVTAQQYQPVSGTYAGILTTAEGEKFSFSSTLTQTSQTDANGIYHVQGSAFSPGNTCVPTTLSATASAITGGSISTTYTDSATGSSITGTGSTSPDGSTITISSWTISSPCGEDTGAGLLTRS